MDKRFLGIVGVIILLFLGVVIFSRDDASAPAGSSNADGKVSNHVKGDNAKKVTLVEYGDFQCPVCALYEPTIKEVFEKYKADIQLQYRHFPLQTIHENALAGARAAEAAGLQGKFWEMHDLLYENQTAWSRSPTPQTFFDQYAAAIKLDTAKYKTDFASTAVNATINADLAAGTSLNITGTPAFFLDGKELTLADLTGDNNQPSAEKFGKLIDAAIKAKQ